MKFRQGSNYCSKVLEAANFISASKTKESITSQKLRSNNKGKSVIPSQFNRPEVLSSLSGKAKLFAKEIFEELQS